MDILSLGLRDIANPKIKDAQPPEAVASGGAHMGLHQAEASGGLTHGGKTPITTQPDLSRRFGVILGGKFIGEQAVGLPVRADQDVVDNLPATPRDGHPR